VQLFLPFCLLFVDDGDGNQRAGQTVRLLTVAFWRFASAL